MNHLTKHTRGFLIDFCYIVVGCAIFSVAMNVFIAPNLIAPGGVSGLAVSLNYIIPFVPIGAWSMLINVPLLLLGLKFIGRDFTVKTLISVVVLWIFIDYLFKGLPAYTGDSLLASLAAGVIMGAGLGLIFMRGITTGGTDILMRLLQIKFPHMPTGQLMLVVDVAVILISAAIFRKIETVLYSLVTVYVASRVIDSIIYGMEKGKLVYIMSKKDPAIAKRVIHDLQRGCTLLKSIGGYSGEESCVLLVAVRNPQYYQLKEMIREEDPDAFLITTDSSEVLGEGFKPIN